MRDRNDTGPLPRPQAESLAAQVLAWLAQDHAHLSGFMAWSGLGLDDLRRALTPGSGGDAGVLLGALEYLLQDDAQVLAFCEAEDCAPPLLLRARAGLPGGEQVHWT